jgi:hypothetical protein
MEMFPRKEKIEDISLPTKDLLANVLGDQYAKDHSLIKELLDILHTQMDEKSIKIQQTTQEEYIAKGKVTP